MDSARRGEVQARIPIHTMNHRRADQTASKLNAFEIEKRMKVDLNYDFTLLGALLTEVDVLEKQTLLVDRCPLGAGLGYYCRPPSMLMLKEKCTHRQCRP